MSNEMVERVAVAIERAWPYQHPLTALELYKAARAAIEAMREPTEGMLALKEYEYTMPTGEMRVAFDIPTAYGIWQVMITAALEDKP